MDFPKPLSATAQQARKVYPSPKKNDNVCPLLVKTDAY